MLIALLLGTMIGILAGFIKSLDGPLMRLTDLFLALPILEEEFSIPRQRLLIAGEYAQRY